MTSIDEDEGCKHGLWPALSCSICNGNEARRSAEASTVVHWFDARYDGRVGCGCYVQVGDRIGRREDDTFVCTAHGR
jgi:hypothetical protein